MPLTLAAAKASRIPIAAGVDAGSDAFLSYLNDAARRLLERGNFWATHQKMRVCTYDGCITWPRFVGTPLAINTRRGSGPVNGYWYEFLQWDSFDRQCFSRGFWPWNVETTNDSLVPIFNQIPCGIPRYVRFYPRTQLDKNKKVTVYGTDSNGQKLYQMRPPPDGDQEGIVLPLDLPFVQTPILLNSVSRISKPVTELPVDVFQYDPTTAQLFPMAYYEPDETEPMYRHSRIQNIRQRTACCAHPVDLLYKIEFRPVKYDSDIVQIDNSYALKVMVMGIKKGEAGDAVGEEVQAKAATKILNEQLRSKLPDDQIPVNFKPFGSADLRKQAIGTLI